MTTFSGLPPAARRLAQLAARAERDGLHCTAAQGYDAAAAATSDRYDRAELLAAADLARQTGRAIIDARRFARRFARAMARP